MTETQILSVFRDAWRGLGVRHQDDPDRLKRSREFYRYRLKEGQTQTAVRGLLAELCAEGGIAIGGLPQLADEADLADFWRLLNDDWQRARDLALLAGAADPCDEEEDIP